MAIFGSFLLILAIVTREMRGNDNRYPVDYLRHPQTAAVLSRLRRDVSDAFGGNPYPPAFQDYKQDEKTLIVYAVQPTGFAQTIVWDFTKEGEVKRSAFSTGNAVSEWIARGTPPMEISAYEVPGRAWGVRLQARDEKGALSIDQIYVPRAH